MDFLKVEGHNSLVRDTSTGAIINKNRTEYEEYLHTLKLAEDRNRVLTEHGEEINNIKNELLDIKKLLQQLVSTK